MKARCKVIAGDYIGNQVYTDTKICKIKKVNVELNSTNVESYEVITDEHIRSAVSGITRGVIGGALLGPVGMLAGGLSGKKKGIYTVAINFKDGKSSLIEIDDRAYQMIVRNCF